MPIKPLPNSWERLISYLTYLREPVFGGVDLAPEILRGAALALRHKLRRRFSAEFVDRHSEDIFAQAAKECAQR